MGHFTIIVRRDDITGFGSHFVGTMYDEIYIWVYPYGSEVVAEKIII